MRKLKRNYYLEENKMKNIIKNIVNAKKEKTTQRLPMLQYLSVRRILRMPEPTLPVWVQS